MEPSERVDYKYRVEVCFMPGQYPLYAPDMGIVVVIDILRATSAMVAAFEHGIDRIIPVATVEEARPYIGREGMVVKPFDFISHSSDGLLQPAIKCRGSEYLRIIYGQEYDTPENLQRLKNRGLSGKQSLAICVHSSGAW